MTCRATATKVVVVHRRKVVVNQGIGVDHLDRTSGGHGGGFGRAPAGFASHKAARDGTQAALPAGEQTIGHRLAQLLRAVNRGCRRGRPDITPPIAAFTSLSKRNEFGFEGCPLNRHVIIRIHAPALFVPPAKRSADGTVLPLRTRCRYARDNERDIRLYSYRAIKGLILALAEYIAHRSSRKGEDGGEWKLLRKTGIQRHGRSLNFPHPYSDGRTTLNRDRVGAIPVGRTQSAIRFDNPSESRKRPAIRWMCGYRAVRSPA